MESFKLTRGAIAYPATSLAYKTGTWRVYRPVHVRRSAPCHGACPAGEDAQAYLARVDEGDQQGAWETLVSANPLPAITGRVCHHPCEQACNRGHFDESIAIHGVERFLGDEAIRKGWSYPVSRPSPSAPEVAVVGAGPAGLSCAYHLIRLGYQVTLFEGMPEAGGTLRMALPPYRLPREVLDAEIERLLAIGIRFEPHTRLGRDVFLDDIQRSYKAVFLGIGNMKGREWSVEGAVPKDLHVGLNLLKEWIDVGSLPMVQSVAIVGGGNTAVDLGRVLKRVGVPEVHVITHQAIPRPEVPKEDWMPAIPREIHQAEEEGVIFHEHRGVRRLILRGEKVVGVEIVHMKKLERPGGRIERVPFEGTETLLHVEQVIPAIGQEVNPEGLETLLDHKPYISVDSWGRVEGHEGIFAGGDARRGAGMVSIAIGDGRRAALAMDAYIKGKMLPEGQEAPVIGYDQLNVNYYEHAPRAEPSILPVEARKGFEEIEGSLTSVQVAGEAGRCFSCGTCFACDNCWTLCPEPAVLKDEEEVPTRYVFDYDYCKGCGLCAHECPCGFIVMEEEP